MMHIGKRERPPLVHIMMHIGRRERPPLVHIMMHVGRRERLPLAPIMMLTRSREKCLLSLIGGDRRCTPEVYQTEMCFRKYHCCIYPEGKSNVLKARYGVWPSLASLLGEIL